MSEMTYTFYDTYGDEMSIYVSDDDSSVLIEIPHTENMPRHTTLLSFDDQDLSDLVHLIQGQLPDPSSDQQVLSAIDTEGSPRILIKDQETGEWFDGVRSVPSADLSLYYTDISIIARRH